MSQSPEKAAETVGRTRAQFLQSVEPPEDDGSQSLAAPFSMSAGEATIDENGVFSMPLEVSPTLRSEATRAAQRG